MPEITRGDILSSDFPGNPVFNFLANLLDLHFQCFIMNTHIMHIIKITFYFQIKRLKIQIYSAMVALK